MPDMLVKLYNLPPLEPALVAAARQGCLIRRVQAEDKLPVLAWVRADFLSWAAEAGVACANVPATCFVARRGEVVMGFACYDATCPNFFGPTGVAKQQRGLGIGRALLLAAMHAQRAQGYAYSIIGGVLRKDCGRGSNRGFHARHLPRAVTASA